MSRDALKTGALSLALVATGALAWWLNLAPALSVDATALGGLPATIDGYHGRDIPLEQTVERVLGAQFNLQRVYEHSTGEIVWLYLGYYGTARGGRPEHTPRGCYTGAGWAIESARRLEVSPGGALRVNEFVVTRDGERLLVHFWFRSHRRTGLVSGLDQNLDRLLGRLLDRRADGALVRLSSPVSGDDVVATRGRLLAFAAALDPLLAARWPEERPAAASS